MRTILVRTFIRYRVTEAMRSYLSGIKHRSGSYVYKDEDAIGNEEIRVSWNIAAGRYEGQYSGTYGIWTFRAEIPSQIKVKPISPDAQHYNETRETVTTH